MSAWGAGQDRGLSPPEFGRRWSVDMGARMWAGWVECGAVMRSTGRPRLLAAADRRTVQSTAPAVFAALPSLNQGAGTQ